MVNRTERARYFPLCDVQEKKPEKKTDGLDSIDRSLDGWVSPAKTKLSETR